MRRLNDEGGNVVIIVAVLATTLFGFLALTIDVGAMLVRRSALQTGSDAAALAIAQRCAEAVVSGSTTCTTAIAQDYLDANAVGGGGVTVTPVLQTSYAGKVGSITVESASAQAPFFAGVLGATGDQTVRADATARWGPLTAVDEVFPLAICRGALPDVDETVELVISPAVPGPANVCDGADGEPPFGWLTPDDPALCASKITLLPARSLDVQPASAYPTNPGCDTAIQELYYDLEAPGNCHTTPRRPVEHCHGPLDANDRSRTVVVYDAATPGRRSYALVQLEFSAVRLGDVQATAGSTSLPAGCEDPDPTVAPPYAPGEAQCFRATVRNAVPPADGPIFDPALAALLPAIDDTTVLDVRLVD